MNRIEPVWGSSASSGGLNDAPYAALEHEEETGQSRRFEVRIARTPGLPAFKRHSQVLGKGLLIVDDNRVVFSGTQRRAFHRARSSEWVCPRNQIQDVHTIGRYVRFDVDGYGVVETIGVRAESKQEAAAIAGKLPAKKTDAFAQEEAARSRFQEALQRASRWTPAVYLLIALNVAMFLAMFASGINMFAPNAALEIRWGTNYGPRTMDGEWWRLATSMFIHFGIIHLAFNMVVLYQVGRLAERMFGSIGFLALYLFTGLCASAASLLWHPLVNSAGASGAIFGVLGALLAYLAVYRTDIPASFLAEQRKTILSIVGYTLFNGLTQVGVDNSAHLGGLAAGLAMGFVLAPPMNRAAELDRGMRRIALSVLLACSVAAAAGYLCLHPSSATRAELAFTKALDTLAKVDAAAAAAGPTLRKARIDTPSGRTALANTIASQMLPQWEAVHTALADARLPADSPRFALRALVLRYTDDRRTVDRLAVQMLRQNRVTDPAVMAQLTALNQDAAQQMAAVKKLAAAGHRGAERR